jgi:hypothetical protein
LKCFSKEGAGNLLQQDKSIVEKPDDHLHHKALRNGKKYDAVGLKDSSKPIKKSKGMKRSIVTQRGIQKVFEICRLAHFNSNNNKLSGKISTILSNYLQSQNANEN